MPAIGTNVPARKASGRIRMKPTPCMASGERTSIPSSTPIQVKANIARTIRPTSSTAWPAPRCGFQPDQAEGEHDDQPEDLLAELAGHLPTDDRQPADRRRAEAVDHAL